MIKDISYVNILYKEKIIENWWYISQYYQINNESDEYWSNNGDLIHSSQIDQFIKEIDWKEGAITSC